MQQEQQEQWWALYKEAVLETDRGKLGERFRLAEAEIAARSSRDGQMTAEEHRALQDARTVLEVLKRKRLTD
jgi:hypothetical protein